MKICSSQQYCHNPNPQPPGNFHKTRENSDGLCGECKVCKRAKNNVRYSLSLREHSAELTSQEERRVDGYKCLALDALTVAVVDYKRGECEPEFWYSDSFDTFCDMAGLHPDYVRRNVLEAEA